MTRCAGYDRFPFVGSGGATIDTDHDRFTFQAMPLDDQSTVIQGWIDRFRAGDESARDSLIECAADRLSRLTRKMIKSYPRVHRWEQTDDVLQNALIRLDRALRAVAPPTARDFFRLAAAQIRRELIDLARHYQGPLGLGANYSTQADAGRGAAEPAEPTSMAGDADRLATWTEFHQRIEALPAEEREIFDLLWYQELTQAEAAVVLDVSERTIGRRWLSARVRIGQALVGRLPG